LHIVTHWRPIYLINYYYAFINVDHVIRMTRRDRSEMSVHGTLNDKGSVNPIMLRNLTSAIRGFRCTIMRRNV